MKRSLSILASSLLLQLSPLPAVGDGESAGPAACAALLPGEGRSRLEESFSGWKVLELDQLDPDDRGTWGPRCPGVATGQFKRPGETGYAVVLVRQSGGQRQSKLIFLEKRNEGYTVEVLRDQTDSGSYYVVHREPPGTFRHVYDRDKAITSQTDVVVFTLPEATATAFYYRAGSFHDLLISD